MTTKKLSLLDRLAKYCMHTNYCKWTRPDGWYDRGKPCTCGRDAFVMEITVLENQISLLKNENERLTDLVEELEANDE